jgi:MraZ protein
VDASLHFKNHALNAVDAKGRVSVPANFRAQLAARAQLVSGQTGNALHIGLHSSGNYLTAHDDAAHNEIDAMLRESVSELPAIERMAALEQASADVLGVTDRFTFDGAGRMVLSPMLRDFGEIGDFAFFVGAGLTFQIWGPKKALEVMPENSVLRRTLAYLVREKGIAL